MVTPNTFLMFHALAEVFAAVVSAGVFMIAWDTRRFSRSSFFLVVGPAFALVGLTDLLHMLAYKGMGTNMGGGANLATQLWVAARAAEVVAVLAGVLLAARPVVPLVPMLTTAVGGSALLAGILVWPVFPVCYVDGVGLTGFKIAAEYGFMLTKLATAAVLWHRRRLFDPVVVHWLAIYLGVSALSELAFTGYVGVYDGMNQVGHLLKVAAYLAIYWATSRAVLQRPYSTLFADLEAARQALEGKVAERTQALAEVNDLLTTLIDSSPMGIFANDLDGRVILWNAGAERIYGWSAEEALGHRLRTAAPEKLVEQESLLADVLAGKPSLGVELERRRKDGSPVMVRDYAAPMRAADGAIRGVVSLVLDITAERAAERAARQGEDRLRGLMANVPDAILTVSEEGLIESASDAAERLFGYRIADLLGQPVSLLMPVDRGQAHDHGMAAYAETGQGRIIGRGPREMVARRKDGAEVPIELALNEMWVDGRRLYVGVLRDITERQRERSQKAAMERELLRVQKMDALGSLAGGIAHEVNNMLTPILGLSEVALMRLPSESPVRGNIEKVVEAASRARDILRKLLAFSRVDTAPPVPLPLRSLVEEALPLVRTSLPRDTRLTCVLPEQDVVVRCAHTEFQQVLMNLCSNAGQAVGGRQGRIDIGLATRSLNDDQALGLGLTAGDYAVLTVSDNGIGMDGVTAEKAFEPFFTTKPVGEGTGLGLSVVHAIVSAWGGAISVHSVPDDGTSIQVILPLQAAVAAPA
jgi:PAS domain S-box-containing protein